MEPMDVEKLIVLVKSNACLYDLKNQNYKNMLVKNLTWEKIGRELNSDGANTKKKWKTVKDGYFKNKKITKGSTGSGRVTSNYIWAEQLRFLDDYHTNRRTASNVTKTPSSSQSSESQQPFSEPDTEAESADAGRSQLPVSPPILLSPRPQLTTDKGKETRAHRKVAPTEREDRAAVSQIIDYLEKKPRNNKDGTDYLFQSYAETFKKFPLTLQAELKVELAKLFADAELRQLRQTREENFNQVLYLTSPSYSMISSADSGERTIEELTVAETQVEHENCNKSGAPDSSLFSYSD